MSEHIRELELRRLFAGEVPAPAADSLRAHLASCPPCAAVWARLEAEQRAFEQDVPFERFEAGVRPRARAARAPAVWRVPAAVGAMAAVLIAVILLRPFGAPGDGGVRLKGGAEMEVRIAGAAGAQRVAEATSPTPLSPGERVRVGYQAGDLGFVASFSVDEQGEVTPLYPGSGQSVPVAPGAGMHYLPDAFELTGHGAERIYVVLSAQPLAVEALLRAAREALQHSGGDVRRMPPLAVSGEQLSRVLEKP